MHLSPISVMYMTVGVIYIEVNTVLSLIAKFSRFMNREMIQQILHVDCCISTYQ